MHLESLAFIPQLFLSAVALPLLAKKDLPSTMLAQTFAFVTFNKVCTSQVWKYDDASIVPPLIIIVVLPLVHGVPPILSAHIVSGCIPATWNNGARPVGFNTSHVAPTGFSSGIYWEKHLRSRTVDGQPVVLSDKCLDSWHHCIWYRRKSKGPSNNTGHLTVTEWGS